MPVKPGLYEKVIDKHLQELITVAKEKQLRVLDEPMDKGESHLILAQYLSQIIAGALREIKGQEKLADQIRTCNKIIEIISQKNIDDLKSDIISEDARRLMQVHNPLLEPVSRPETPLANSALLTGTRNDPSMVSQLQKEIASADRVDIICSFIKWSGIRILRDALQKFSEREGARLRVITTSYLGATDLKAIDALHALPNTKLYVTYDTRRTRLHAKSYIFHRESGFGTAYVGSANISQPALTDGLEWNVKISQYESPHLWDKICATFQTYANDSEFTPYSSSERDRLKVALRKEGGSDYTAIGAGYLFEIKPYEYQREILDNLQVEREIHHRNKNLVVAATGTGKTVIAAFDYYRFKNMLQSKNQKARLLFVAHRKEILEQSRACFRGVLRDQNFGQLLVGHYNPDGYEYLFASIQSINSRRLCHAIPDDFFDYIVIDEIHHAPANSYQPLLEHFKPKILLGLTATPERSDSRDVFRYFENKISAEIRLPDAINKKLLCPFQYFGVTDSVDYDQIQWTRGGYDIAELDNLISGNDMRAGLVIRKIKEILLDVSKSRGLCFCVNKRHARFMAQKLNDAGIAAEALISDSSVEERSTVKRRLRDFEINFICVVDLYNEGVDIPEIDTVLFLRPTESLTVFLQQLGRGLRMVDSKECLTVLDFVGQANKNFNYESRFRALLGKTKKRIDDEIKGGFPSLPAGCVVDLERVAQEHVLNNLKYALSHANRHYIVQKIANFSQDTGRALGLKNFIEYYRLDLDDIYRKDSWSRLCAEAGMVANFSDPDEKRLSRGLRRISHINSVALINRLIKLIEISTEDNPLENLAIRDQRILTMFICSLWGRNGTVSTFKEFFVRLNRNDTMQKEVVDLLNIKLAMIDSFTRPILLPFEFPAEIHGLYTRDEILAAVGLLTVNNQISIREGVKYVRELNADLLFVTLNKTESDYSPTTMYEDYAISEELFHWQSQSTTSETSPTGCRYIQNRKRGNPILLFVREHKKINGLACPYNFLGPVDYVEHSGSRPMSIIWKLQNPMPAHLLRQTARLATA